VVADWDEEPTDGKSVNWLSPQAVQLAVGQVVKHHDGTSGEIIDLPGDGTVWIQPFRGGEKLQFGVDVFNQVFLIRKDF
jgi:hypothetical protein